MLVFFLFNLGVYCGFASKKRLNKRKVELKLVVLILSIHREKRKKKESLEEEVREREVWKEDDDWVELIEEEKKAILRSLWSAESPMLSNF